MTNERNRQRRAVRRGGSARRFFELKEDPTTSRRLRKMKAARVAQSSRLPHVWTPDAKSPSNESAANSSHGKSFSRRKHKLLVGFLTKIQDTTKIARFPHRGSWGEVT